MSVTCETQSEWFVCLSAAAEQDSAWLHSRFSSMKSMIAQMANLTQVHEHLNGLLAIGTNAYHKALSAIREMLASSQNMDTLTAAQQSLGQSMRELAAIYDEVDVYSAINEIYRELQDVLGEMRRRPSLTAREHEYCSQGLYLFFRALTGAKMLEDKKTAGRLLEELLHRAKIELSRANYRRSWVC